MEKLPCITVLQFLYFQSPSQENDGSCSWTTHTRRYLAIFENSPLNGSRYSELDVIALDSHEHKGNYACTECIGSHFNKISTPLVMPVHSYGTIINMGVSWLKKSSLSKQTNGGGPLRLAR